MAKLIKADGETRELRPADGTDCFTLEELQKYVGGYIEVVRCRLPVPEDECPLLIVNEEGTIHRLPENVEASHKAGVWLVGDVIQLTLPEWRALRERG
jgi:hypothetical protein